ncbi:UNVERIFIED_CONTAM: phosphate ABC transporter substrate-binding protein, partial [Lactobacillus acidophilus]|nr:phosphate ABC transporter substrate-binding protein [Lactobacillus acidophilus]
YIMSSPIQKKLVQKMGYIPMTQMKVVRDASGHVSKQ